jgi:putative ABC transport system permease protein
MGRLRIFSSRLWGLFNRRNLDRDLDAEVRAHLEMLTTENIRRGMSPEDARHAARREFGGLEQAKELYREQRGLPFLDHFMQDVRFALRSLGKRPGFTLVAVFTLAIGIGANTAIFTAVHSVLLQSLPFPKADRLAIVWSTLGTEGRAPASGPELAMLSQQTRLFEDLGAIWAQSGALTGEGEPEQVRLGMVTANFFGILGTAPQVGRYFEPGEQGPGSPRAMIISDGLWHRRFGADPRWIGKTVRLNGQSVTMVGVMPPGFRIIFPEGSSVPPEMDAYVPFRSNFASSPADQSYLRVIGRLRVGVTITQAQQEMDTLAGQIRAQYPTFADPPLTLQVVPLQGDVVRNIRPALLALFGGAGLVLLIACVNVANLLLARANERTLEMAVRTAIGAGRGRLIRQLLTESVLLSCCGAVAALGFGWCALKLVLAMQPKETERFSTIQMNPLVFVFTFIVAIVVGALFGLAPALGTRKLDLARSLKDNRQTCTRSGGRQRNLLVISEVALGFVLLIGAGLMLRTFVRLLQVNPGFDATNVLTFRISVASVKYQSPDAAVQFFRKLKENLSQMPGVETAGVISHLPFDDTLPNWYGFYWRDGASKHDQNTTMADLRSSLPGYFKSMGATFLSGRDFDDHDVAENLKLAIVDDTVAKESWAGQDVVGKLINIENGNFVRDTAEVIGVVKHMQYHTLTDQVRGQIYLLYPQAIRAHMAVTLKSSASTQTLLPLIRQQVASLDKDLPIYQVEPMTDYVESARRQTRFVTLLAGIMGGIALLLACIGIYAVTMYSVLQRMREIGVRTALGAAPRQLFALVLRQSMLPIALGLLAGFALALLLTPFLSSLLFGVRPTDISTFCVGALILSTAGLIACLLPARRATRVDPVIALRYE